MKIRWRREDAELARAGRTADDIPAQRRAHRGVASGKVPPGNRQGDPITSWFNPTSVVFGRWL